MPKKKRRSAKEIIESSDKSREQSFLKFLGEEPKYITKKSDRFSNSSDEDKIDYEIARRRRNGKRTSYMHLHTHPGKLIGSAFPSSEDFAHLIRQDNEQIMTIAVREENYGDVIGYTMLFKDKSFPKFRDIENDERTLDFVTDALVQYGKDSETPHGRYTSLKILGKQLGIGMRFHPAKGYYIDKNLGNYMEKRHNLEGAISSVLIGSVLLLLLAGIPLTGSVVSNISSVRPYLGFGIIILLVLLFGVGVYFLLKPYKKK